MANASQKRRPKSNLLVKVAVALAVFAGVAVLFMRSVRDTRLEPYTVERAGLGHWTLATEPASSSELPMLVLKPPPELASNLFRQVFLRTMQTLRTPETVAVPLVLQGEFDRANVAHVTPDALMAAARAAGLETAAFEPRCLAARRVSEPGVIRELFFVIFDAPAFGTFREQVSRLLGGGAPSAGFDPAELSPVLLLAASDPTFSRWLPLHADPAADCRAPIVTR